MKSSTGWKIINVNLNNGKVIFSENAAWEMDICEIEKKDGSIILNKRFLKCINDTNEEIEFSMFDTFILIQDEDSNIMLSYEQDFSDSDV